MAPSAPRNREEREPDPLPGPEQEAAVNVSLISGWLPPLVAGVAVALLLAGIGWRSADGRRQAVLGLGAGLVAGAVTAGLVHWLAAPSPPLPWTVWLWTALVVTAVVVAVAGWSGSPWWRRLLRALALVALVLAGLGAVNAHYGTFPTAERLVTLEPEHLLTLPQLQAVRQATARTGHLPDEGVVVAERIPATVSHFRTSEAYLYLPPAWFAPVTPHLPTLVLLPGEPGSSADWVQSGEADETADRFAAAHDGVAPILIMPDPNGDLTVDSECVNSQFGNAETYLTVDIPAFARTELGAATGPDSLAVAGLSAGGSCATFVALRNPNVYPTFAAYSGYAEPIYQDDDREQTIKILFGGSVERFEEHDPLHLLTTRRYGGTAAWFEVGSQDAAPLAAAQLLAPAARAAGIETCVLERAGGHDFALWSQALRDSLPWLSWRLGLTPEPPTEPATCTPGRS